MLTLDSIQGVHALNHAYSPARQWDMLSLQSEDPILRQGLEAMASGLRAHAISCTDALSKARPRTAFGRVAWRDCRHLGDYVSQPNLAQGDPMMVHSRRWERTERGAVQILANTSTMVERLLGNGRAWVRGASEQDKHARDDVSHEALFWRFYELTAHAWPLLMREKLVTPVVPPTAKLRQPGRTYLQGLCYGFAAISALPGVLQDSGSPSRPPQFTLPAEGLKTKSVSSQEWTDYWRNNSPVMR